MRSLAAALLVVGFVSLSARDAAAQPTAEDQAAAAALSFTHVGTFGPHIMLKGWTASGKPALDGRLGIFSPKSGDGNNSLGVTGSMNVAPNAVLAGTLGYTMVGCPAGATCDNGLLLGVDALSNLWASATNTIHVNFQGSLGYSTFGSDLNFLSGAVNFPLIWSLDVGTSARSASRAQAMAAPRRLILHFTPGYGYGRQSMTSGTTTVSENGMRPIWAAGAGYNFTERFMLGGHINQVLIEDAGTNFGLRASLSW